MVRSAAVLIRTRGVTATSFSEVLADSKAPRGSIYHHFPNGKEQLAQDAIRWTTERAIRYQSRCPARTPAEVLDWFVAMWRQVVVDSGATEGCAIAGVAVDTGAGEGSLMSVVHSAFNAYIDLVTDQLAAAGVPGERARTLAITALAAVEGALILCRAERSVTPLEVVASELRRLLPSGGQPGRTRTPARRRSPQGERSASRRSR